MRISRKKKDEYTSLGSGKGLGSYDNENLLENINEISATCNSCGCELIVETKHNDLDFFVMGTCGSCGKEYGKTATQLVDKKKVYQNVQLDL